MWQKLTFNMLDAHFSNKGRIKDAGGKGAPKYVTELLIQTANAHFFEIPIGAKSHTAPTFGRHGKEDEDQSK